MANPYVKQTWVDGSGGGTPLSAARMAVIETGVFDAHYPAAAVVFHNAAQSITTSTITALAFNSERVDTESNAASTIHDTVTNNSRLTAKTAGIYIITASVEWASNTTGERYASIRLNGTTDLTRDRVTAGSVGAITHSISRIYSLAVNDYVEVTVWQTSGGGLNVNSTGNYSPEFCMARIA